VDVLLHKWSWRRFERMFEQHLIRKGIEDMKRSRDAMIAAVHSNSAWEGKENQEAKMDRIQQTIDACNEGIAVALAGNGAKVEKKFDPLEEDPLFAPFRAMGSRIAQDAQPPLAEQAGIGHAMMAA
jgi:hypothetical protein